MCWISPGNVCLGSPMGNYVLDHSWETMCCIRPWKLCVVTFGPQVLGPQLWFPVLARQGPWPIGPVCVASRLAYYVLHQCLETMCCIALRRRWSCMTHHDDDHYHHDHDRHRCSWQTCAKKSEGLGRVGFYFSKFEAPLDNFPSSALLAVLESCSPGKLAGIGWPEC